MSRHPRTTLGRTGVEVSRLCLGLGSSGCGNDSIQARRPHEEVAELLALGHALGATWWDTSDDYGTHAHVRHALRRVPRHEVQITTKTHASTARGARESVRQSLAEMGVDRVEVLLMHEVDTVDDLAERREALCELHRLRRDGIIGAVGLSTHAIDVLERVAGDAEVDVLLTNYNLAGDHMDADLRDYEAAMMRAHAAGQAVCVMKTVGEGRLAHRVEDCLRHNLSRAWIHGVLIGVKSCDEVQAAARIWLLDQARPIC